MSMALPLNDAAGRVTEADWIEAAKFELLVKGISGSHLAALLVLFVLNGLLLGYVPLWQQVLWLVFGLGVSVLRYRFVAHYRNHIVRQPVRVHVEYMHKTRWFWAVYAAMWAAGSWLFVGRLPPERDVVCWMLVAGVAAVGVSWVSVDRKTVQSYLITYLLLVSAGVAVRALWGGPDADSPFNLWLPGLLAAYWLVLLRVSSMLSELYIKSIDLRYHNVLLVESLQQQTQIAQAAVNFKDRFLAGAAHDLKQPVNALGLYAEWLTQEPGLVDELGPKILQATRGPSTACLTRCSIWSNWTRAASMSTLVRWTWACC